MLDSVLHLLTNRATFLHGSLPSVSFYEPHEEDEGEAYLRDMLLLREGDPVWCLAGLVAAARAFPDVYEEFGESHSTVVLSDLARPEPEVSGGYLVSAFGDTAFVEYRPDAFPPPETTTVKYRSSTTAMVARGDDRIVVGCVPRTGSLVSVEWPEGYGLGGVLDMSPNQWASGSEIVVRHAPDVFPYKALSDKAGADSRVFNHLSALGTMKMFHSAQTPLEKTAILALSVANPWKHLPDEE